MPTLSFHDIASSSGSLALTIVDADNSMKVKGIARLFDLVEKKQISEFPVHHECPGFGTRLAIGRDAKSCFVGCYDAYGIAGYSLPHGKELWRRKDLKSVQKVKILDFQNFIFCGRQTGTAHLLDAKNGETVQKLNGVKSVFSSPFDDSVIIDGRSLEIHRPFGKKHFKIDRKSKAIRTCVFSKSEVIISESGDLIRCFDLESGGQVWEITPPQSVNYTRFAFHIARRCFVAVAEKTDSYFVFLHPETGKVLHETVREKFGYGEFCCGGDSFLRGNLCLHSTTTGELLHDFTTPKIMACDPRFRQQRLQFLIENANSTLELEAGMRTEGFLKEEIKLAVFRRMVEKAVSAPELEKYMQSEGFSKKEIERAVLFKRIKDMDRKKAE